MQERDATMAATVATASHGEALDGAVNSTASLGDATALTTEEINAMSKANQSHMSLLARVQGLTDDYNDSLAETILKYGESSQEVQELQANHQAAMNQIIYDLYLARLAVDGFTEAEVIAAEKAGISMGIFSQEVIDVVKELEKTGGALNTFGGNAKENFNDARIGIAGAKDEVVKLKDDLKSIPSKTDVSVNMDFTVSGDTSYFDVIYDIGHIGEGGRSGRKSTGGGGMPTAYPSQMQQPAIDYNLLAMALRDAITPLIK